MHKYKRNTLPRQYYVVVVFSPTQIQLLQRFLSVSSKILVKLNKSGFKQMIFCQMKLMLLDDRFLNRKELLQILGTYQILNFIVLVCGAFFMTYSFILALFSLVVVFPHILTLCNKLYKCSVTCLLTHYQHPIPIHTVRL